ncbi:MAG: hypothetical protein A9Z00_01055 [Thermobacillus sp. ZCTH02-B1]|nr:MAG: hypothetical protein A9Z00_01055 [Thermobacillus sp. ZCTH02-B1]
MPNSHLPFYIMQNICLSLIGILMTLYDDNQNMQTHMQKLSERMKDIYAQTSSQELCGWMKQWLVDWVQQIEEQSGKKSNRLVEEVKEYVKQHYHEDISLMEIAEKLYVNRNYLSQLFKRVTGESFATYLNKFRIEKAKEKMRENHYLISEISEMVGYQNPTYFSQVFKSITGKSPSEFYK